MDNPALVGLLGSIYWWKGESKKSLPLIKQSVSGLEKLYGLNDSSLIQPLINLAMAHYRLQNYGRLKAFKAIFQYSLESRRRQSIYLFAAIEFSKYFWDIIRRYILYN